MPLLQRSACERERLAEMVALRLDKPMAVLGVIFLLLVVAETTVRPTGRLSLAFQIAGWAIWALFVTEFVARMVVAPSTRQFLRRNWWQVVFLAVPFLRFIRVLRAVRAARMGRVLSSAVRSAQTAGRRLGSRLGWLVATTAVVILAGSQVVYELGEFESYGQALRATALATIVGEPMGQESGVVGVIEVALAIYSVVVFATLAGSLGAFFLEQHGPREGH